MTGNICTTTTLALLQREIIRTWSFRSISVNAPQDLRLERKHCGYLERSVLEELQQSRVFHSCSFLSSNSRTRFELRLPLRPTSYHNLELVSAQRKKLAFSIHLYHQKGFVYPRDKSFKRQPNPEACRSIKGLLNQLCVPKTPSGLT